MAITSSYPIAPPTITDTLVGTKFIENKEPTTNSFNIGDLVQLVINTIDTYNSYTPTSRTLTINGTTYDLSANRSWTVGDTGSLEFNSTDLTVWNNGKGNVTTNTSFGELALMSNTTGDANSAIGYRALNANTIGGGNTAIGISSLRFNTQGNFNTSIGWASMSANISGVENTALGMQSLDSNTTGDYNVSIGARVLSNNTTGQYNTAVGMQSLGNNESGTNNTALGYGAGVYATGASSNNVYIGNRAGPSSGIVINNKLYISNENGTPLIGGDFSAKTVSIDGAITVTQFNISTLNTAPASATATGTLGEIRYDANYMYVCVATNTWKRSALTTW